ncbi:MAG: serine hydroxymethyltransferase [Enterobacteriaceae bacterium]
MLKKIKISDPQIWNVLKKEKLRQDKCINLIASENYASEAVMQAQGSFLTNKYAEGYPHKRYYGGCKYVDVIEQIAIERAKILFRANYANVQPHSGSQANFAIYNAFLNPGDCILSMDLSHGGHLTHGSNVNFSGKLFNVISYGVNENGEINYEQIYELAKIYNPKMIIAGFSSYSRIVNWKKISHIANSVKSYFLADIAHVAGLVAAGIYPSPIKYADFVTATTHKTLGGPRGGIILSKSSSKNIHKKINSSVFPGIQGGPLLHVIAAKAISFKEAMKKSFKDYQKKVILNANILADVFISRNFKLTSNVINNHLFVVNLTNRNITGKQAEVLLNKANIVVNKNSVPNDNLPPSISSGIRIGTASITKRKLNRNIIVNIGNWICDILDNEKDHKNLNIIKKNVINICINNPIYF